MNDAALQAHNEMMDNFITANNDVYEKSNKKTVRQQELDELMSLLGNKIKKSLSQKTAGARRRASSSDRVMEVLPPMPADDRRKIARKTENVPVPPNATWIKSQD